MLIQLGKGIGVIAAYDGSHEMLTHNNPVLNFFQLSKTGIGA
jgi:hypothetical protein